MRFVLHIEATGLHGCQREVRSGHFVGLCNEESCVDCMARRLVTAMVQSGVMVEIATLTHWTDGPVIDDLKTGIRKGTF